MSIDIEALRNDLNEEALAGYFGAGLGGALVESFDIEKMSPDALVNYAAINGINLRRYQKQL